MLRAVLDTNVVVSALVSRGPTSQLVDFWQGGRFHLLVSNAVLEEYLRVLAYPKFRLSVEEVKGLAQRQLLPFIRPVQVEEVPAVIPADPSDDIFLACAVAGHAEYLVSGDRHLLGLRRYQGIAVVTAGAFLAKLHAV